MMPKSLLASRTEARSPKPNTAPSGKAGRQLLFWGDAQELEFSLPNRVASADIVESKLSLTGYYEGYSSLPNADRGGGAFISDGLSSTAVNPLHVLGAGPICPASRNCPQGKHRHLLAGRPRPSTVDLLASSLKTRQQLKVARDDFSATTIFALGPRSDTA